MTSSLRKSGYVTTFYSYKGGVGRTFLMANVAYLLASWGNRVLCLDWDLEAPGLLRYLNKSGESEFGVLDLLEGIGEKKEKKEKKWQDFIVEPLEFSKNGSCLHVIGAGSGHNEYVSRLQNLDWELLSNNYLEYTIERWRSEWIREYDHILIDSRTGISDVGGICAAQLPDLLVLLFTANFQSLEGAVDIADRAQSARAHMPLDRGSFSVLPIPSRIHVGEESKLEDEWSKRFAQRLKHLYFPWKNRAVETREYLNQVQVIEDARWSFGESLPVAEEEIDNPRKISFSFSNIASLIDHQLVRSGMISRDRHQYIAESVGSDSLRREENERHYQYDVFLSHSGAQTELAVNLADELTDSGLKVFLDREQLTPGSKWREDIVHGMNNSKNFVVLLSSNETTEFQDSELLHIARRSQEDDVGVVIPVLLDDSAIQSAPREIQKYLGLHLGETSSVVDIGSQIRRAIGIRSTSQND